GSASEGEGPFEALEAVAAAGDVGADVDPDLAGIDQVDVDAAFGQGGGHAGGDAGVGPHADADDGELGQDRLDRPLADAHGVDGGHGPVGGVAGHGEREDRIPGDADVLHDHVYEDAGLGDGPEDARGVAGPVRDVEQGDPGLRLIELDPGDDEVLHP